ncbi:hypothetical protein DSO57_1015778 [Entomophthora muscae]|uniref:Uncharacterized protein n=1 Tax=Entomophthora muscae TaxID=34485 RepID=A0ACC2T503_9FUNG|nr:hypothetical protein DSO57_1015778 [Entomophthora muscae]
MSGTSELRRIRKLNNCIPQFGASLILKGKSKREGFVLKITQQRQNQNIVNGSIHSTVTPIIADGLSGEGFTAQLDKLKSQENSDDRLEVQAAGPHDLWASGDPKVTPGDAQTMGPELTRLRVSEGHLIQNDGNTRVNDKAMKRLSLDHQMEVIPAEEMAGQKIQDRARALRPEETEQLSNQVMG